MRALLLILILALPVWGQLDFGKACSSGHECESGVCGFGVCSFSRPCIDYGGYECDMRLLLNALCYEGYCTPCYGYIEDNDVTCLTDFGAACSSNSDCQSNRCDQGACTFWQSDCRSDSYYDDCMGLECDSVEDGYCTSSWPTPKRLRLLD
jgi:hypothetical protein